MIVSFGGVRVGVWGVVVLGEVWIGEGMELEG